MAKRLYNRSRVAPLQTLEVVPITDPAEQAALETRIRQAEERAAAAERRRAAKSSKPVSATELLDLARQLPPEQRFWLAAQLADEQSPVNQLALVRRLAAQLSPEALQPSAANCAG